MSDDKILVLNDVIGGLTLAGIPITLVTQKEAERYVSSNVGNFSVIKTQMFKFNDTIFTAYINRFEREIIIAVGDPSKYILSGKDNDYFLSIVEPHLKETYLDSMTDPKSVIAFAKVLKIELQEGIDRAVAKYLETIKYD